MANAIYPKFKEALLSPGIDLVNGYLGSGSGAAPSAVVLKAVLVTSAYTYNAAHQFASSLAGQVGTPQALASKTVAGGVLNAASIVFPTVATGSTAVGIALYLDTGTPSTSRLVAFIDTLTGSTAMSIVTNGGDVTINWDTGAPKIFAL
ncbi:hypothetical protein [Roseococcus sp.]|uniref:hypothetical protein n=1 Tax=Roseococcus sp. TaxID=2109646 RepID=UPI003BA98D72